MKIILIATIIIFSQTCVSAQTPLVFSHDTALVEVQGTNLADTILYFGDGVDVLWLGDTAVTMHWRRMNFNCQEEWGFIVGDKNITLPPNSSSENPIPLEMEPNSSFEMLVEVVHEGVAGCCDVSIEFSTESGQILDTCHFVFRLNSDCSETTSASGPKQDRGLAIYPNPVIDVVHVSSGEEIGTLHVIDSFGRIVRQYDRNEYQMNQIDVQGLSPGLYFIRIHVENGQAYTRAFIKA